MDKNPLVSVLVHTRNSQRTIKQHLESIRSQSYKNIEIIVIDNNSTDNTAKIARQFTAKIFNYGPERSAQRNQGASKALGDYYLVPDSDMVLGKNVVKQCVSLALKNQIIKAIVIPEKSQGKGFWAKCKMLERSFYPGISWMEGSRFFEKRAFNELGGYDEMNTGTEDFDLPQRVIKIFGKESTGRIKEYIYHDEGRLSLFYLLKKKFYYGKSLHIYKKTNASDLKIQANIIKRISLFFSKPRKLLANPLVGLGMIFMKTLEFAAGGFGYILSKNKNI